MSITKVVRTRTWEEPQTAEELAAGITPTNTSYDPGDVRRYGAVADSDLTTAGTDCTTAFNNAILTGHKVTAPPGYMNIAGTIQVFGNNPEGTIHIELSAGTRLQRYDSGNSAPILHCAGTGISIKGNGAVIAARNGAGGWNKGALLLGADPAGADNTGDDMKDTTNNWIQDLKIIGQSAYTGWDGSVGVYLESAARRRGQFISPSTLNCFYNTFSGVYSTQFDYCFFCSTDANANAFTQCSAKDYGHAAVHINGYGNTFSDWISESPTVQDATERAVFHFGQKDTGPEAVHQLTDEDCTTQYSVTGVAKGATTTLTIGTHSFNTGDLLRITGIVDNGPGGDLEAALNGLHAEVTATGATTITIPLDTSALSNTYASGGTVYAAPYPIYGAYANQIYGWSEFAYSVTTRKVRLCLFDDPQVAFDTLSTVTNRHKNVVRVSGAHPGGVANDGFSTLASVKRNRIDNTTVGFKDYNAFRAGDLASESLDDLTGTSWGSDNVRTFQGRMASLAESTAYDVLTIDDVGPNDAGVYIKLTYIAKEDANSNVEGGEISWLCPVTSNTNRTAIKVKDFTANENAPVGITWSITDAAGTTANHGKFTLVCTTGSVAGTGNFFVAWKAEVVHTELYETTMDWESECTVPNGGV